MSAERLLTKDELKQAKKKLEYLKDIGTLPEGARIKDMERVDLGDYEEGDEDIYEVVWSEDVDEEMVDQPEEQSSGRKKTPSKRAPRKATLVDGASSTTSTPKKTENAEGPNQYGTFSKAYTLKHPEIKWVHRGSGRWLPAEEVKVVTERDVETPKKQDSTEPDKETPKKWSERDESTGRFMKG